MYSVIRKESVNNDHFIAPGKLAPDFECDRIAAPNSGGYEIVIPYFKNAVWKFAPPVPIL
jgi:hypothetical protein